MSGAVAAVVSFASSSLLGLNKRPSQPDIQPFGAEQQGRQVILRSAVVPRRIIYGTTVLSGPLMYACKSGSEPEPYLHLVIALAGHECAGIGSVWLGEDEVTTGELDADGWVSSGKFARTVSTPRVKSGTVPATPYQVTLDHTPASIQSVTVTRVVDTGDEGESSFETPLADGAGYSLSGSVLTFDAEYTTLAYVVNYTSQATVPYVRIKKYLGTSTQVADAALVAASVEGDNSRWTSAHRGRGVCYVIVSLRRSPDLFPLGVPNIKASVQGKLLYDPRTATTAHSNNAALCVYDYLTSSQGLGCAAAEIGTTLLNAAANVCDENVTIDSVGTTQDRYTTDGVISLDERPIEVLERLLTSMAGAAIYSFGTWDVYAGAYQTPVYTIDEDDLRGALTVSPRPSRKDLFNAVGGTYIDPTTNQATSFPTVTNSTYETQDGGVRIVRSVELPFVREPIRAQRLAKIALEKSRQGRTIQWPGKMTCFRLNTWKTVNVTVDLLGLSSAVHLITGWKWDPQGGVDLTLQEEASTVYDWAYGEATTRDSAPDTNLPLPNTAPGAPGAPTVTEELYETTGSAGVKVRAHVSWEASQGPYAREYFLEYKAAAAEQYQRVSASNGTRIDLNDIADGYHLMRTQVANDLGVLSAFSPVSTVLILGLSTPPSNVEEFTLTPLLDGQAELAWKRHPDLDVRIGGQIQLRFSPLTSAPSWNDCAPLDAVPGGLTSAKVPMRTGTYRARAVDSGGRPSASSVYVITTEPDLAGYNAVETVTAEPAWEGTKSHVWVKDGKLRLGSGLLVSEMTTPMSTWGQIVTLGGVASEGTITLDEVIDLGAVYTSRLTLALETLSFNTDDKVSQWLQPMSTWAKLSGPEIATTGCEMFVATTEDDPAGAPTWSDWSPFAVGLYRARGFKFKARLRSGNSEHNIEISALEVTIDMPDRDQALDFTTSSGGDTTITWTLTPGFKATPKLGVTFKNMATGDYPVITGESASGFTVNAYNAAGTRVVRNATARGKSY